MVSSEKILSAARHNWWLNSLGFPLSFVALVVLVRVVPVPCGRPCLVASDDFRETLGRFQNELLFRGDDPLELAGKLRALLAKSAAERDEIGLYLRAQVERLHSLPRLAGRILEELARCVPNRIDRPPRGL